MGNPLGDDPTLDPGQSVTVSATGFTASASVDVTVHSTPQDLGTVTADSTGTVTYAFVVPATLEAGSHTLVFTSGSTTGTYAFTVSTTAATTVATDDGTTDGGTTDTSGSTLPHTGADVALYLLVAAALMVAGVGLLGWSGGLATSKGRHR